MIYFVMPMYRYVCIFIDIRCIYTILFVEMICATPSCSHLFHSQWERRLKLVSYILVHQEGFQINLAISTNVMEITYISHRRAYLIHRKESRMHI
jgi:hypothetical protein